MSTELEPAASPAAFVRLQQKQVVSEIPAEIFHEIFSYLGSSEYYESSVRDIKPDMTKVRNRAIHSMALVCRHFYNHVFPMLFENVYIFGSDNISDKKKGTPVHCRIFCRKVVEGNKQARRLATYTKRFAIVSLNVGKKYSAAKQSPEMEEDLSTFSKTLAYMTNLQELYLFSTSITDDLLQSAACLPPLNVLRLEHCNVPKALNASLLVRFSALQVGCVYMEQEISNGDAFPYDQFTRHLCMSQTERFTSDSCVEGHILRGLAASSSPIQHLQYLHLETVRISREHPELISDALAVMPALKSLHIAEIHYRGGHWDLHEERAYRFKPCSSYPKLPHLVHIYAPLYAVQALVPDSNATSVGFSREFFKNSTGAGVEYPNGDDFWHGCAGFLDKSKYYMFQLDIPAAFYRSVSFATYFPELRRLSLRVAHCNWNATSFWAAPEPMIKNFLEWWNAHPRLDELEFIYASNLSSGSPPRISFPQDVMYLLNKKIPTLKSLKFLYAKSKSEQYVDMDTSVLDR